MNNRQELVKEIIEANRYLSLATTDGEEPWVAPVEYVADEELNVYFQSLGTSRHIQHIQQNPTVGVSIYNSQQPSRTGRGVQIRGKVEKYEGETIAGVARADALVDPQYTI